MAHLIEQASEIGVDDIRSGVAGYGIVAVIRGGAVSQFEGRIVHRELLDALPVKESTGLPYVLRAEACSESGKWVPVSHACGRDCQMAVVLAAAHVPASPRDALPEMSS
ncbi:hypothetical protein ACFU9X_17300 [Streptomyces atratus]|uniref:hypothetical protein n=1 Tax=Streptomyces atratus TaxID=1893 RepID=UPI0036C7C75E